MKASSGGARFAQRTTRLRASTIREMLKATQQPDVISFGGGLPAPELFPTRSIGRIAQDVMERVGPIAVQYRGTEGVPEMRRWVARRLTARFDTNFASEEVLITNGSQQGLDLVAKVFLDPGDHVVLERPSYLGAIQAFDSYEARYLTVDVDDDGMIPDSLDRVLANAESAPKFVYVVPNFQNPTGRTLSASRRESIVRVCEHFDIPLVEDDPYGELQFEGEAAPSLISFDSRSPIIYSGTGSKILAPGLRVAWLVMRDQEVFERLVLAKQAVDLHTGSLAQYIFHGFASQTVALEQHITTIRHVYGSRLAHMYECLQEIMPASVHFNRPKGGMFLWASVEQDGFDTEALLKVAAQEKVLFVPGISFYPHRDVRNGMRLNFSNAGKDAIRHGIERLGYAVRSFL